MKIVAHHGHGAWRDRGVAGKGMDHVGPGLGARHGIIAQYGGEQGIKFQPHHGLAGTALGIVGGDAKRPARCLKAAQRLRNAGQGDGVIAGGTGRYANWSGSFSDRVFVGFGEPTSGVGGIVYYDQLWFGIRGK